MNLFDQINNIDEYIEKIKLRDSQDILLASGHGLDSLGMGIGSSGLVWSKQGSVLKPDMDGGLIWSKQGSVLKPDMDGGLVWADKDSVLKPDLNDSDDYEF